MSSTKSEDEHVDVLTVIGIAIVAYCVTAFVHEELGHGTACTLVGGKQRFVNAILFRCDESTVTTAGKRVVGAAGSVANLALAGLSYIALKLRKGSFGPAHYFLWLLFAVNLLSPFGYMLLGGVGGIGDWALVVESLQPVALYRVLLAIVGGVPYFVVARRLLMPGLDPYLGREPSQRKRRAKLVAFLPYLTGGAALMLAALPNPNGPLFGLISAAGATLGGTFWLAWCPGTKNDGGPGPSASDQPASIPRSVPWVIAGAVTLVAYAGVLGPGIKL